MFIRKKSFWDRNKIFIISATVSAILGITFGALGTVSKDVYTEFSKSINEINMKISEKENIIEENEKELIALANKEKELQKQQEELIEKENKAKEDAEKESSNIDSEESNSQINNSSNLGN